MTKLFPVAAGLILLAGSSAVLGAGDPEAGKAKSVTCAACHGADGNSADPQYPSLAGQGAPYTYKQLQNFKSKERDNAIMYGMVAALSEQDMMDLAAYFEAQSLQGGEAEPDLVEQGGGLYLGGDVERGIAACMACHGPSGRGNPAARFPALWGQHADYLSSQLQAFRSMQRNNDPGEMMRNIAIKMTDADIKAVSSYMQGLRE